MGKKKCVACNNDAAPGSNLCTPCGNLAEELRDHGCPPHNVGRDGFCSKCNKKP